MVNEKALKSSLGPLLQGRWGFSDLLTSKMQCLVLGCTRKKLSLWLILSGLNFHFRDIAPKANDNPDSKIHTTINP